MNPTAEFRSFIDKAVAHLKEDLKSIRTGHATPALVENIAVTTYGGSTTLRLMEIASLTTEGPSTIIIQPFDQSTIADIEKAFTKSALGLSPVLQGSRLIVKIPPLSQEQREKFTKLAGQKVEEHKLSVRGARDDARRTLKTQFEKKEITEDVRYRYEKDIDTATQHAMDQMQTIRESKEKEIMTI